MFFAEDLTTTSFEPEFFLIEFNLQTSQVKGLQMCCFDEIIPVMGSFIDFQDSQEQTAHNIAFKIDVIEIISRIFLASL